MPGSKSETLYGVGVMLLAFSLVAVGVLRWSARPAGSRTVIELAHDGVTHEFIDLAERFPDRFRQYYPDGPTAEAFADALQLGRDTFVAEACGHCHTQRVRGVPSDTLRWGPVAQAEEYDNDLQRHVFLTTRRVGPDLSREAARRSNDWHHAHFFQPTNVVPTSVMPAYPWFFDDDDYPNRRGIAIITYLQWLGS